MRVKLSFSAPLQPLKCWYHVSRENISSVHRLQEAIAREFNIDHPLVLEMDSFRLMPRSQLSGLVKNEDLIIVKPIIDDFEAISEETRDTKARDRKKRKASKIEHDAPDEKKRKKLKRAKKSSGEEVVTVKMDTLGGRKKMGEKRMKHKRAERKQPAAAERQVKPQGKSANTATPKPHKKETQPRVTEETREKSIPGEGKHTTRTRNLRRRMLKKARAIDRVNENVPVIEPQSNQDSETPQMDHVHDTGVLNGIVPSSSLLKRNRNKKRGFLNQEQSKEHVRFDTPTVNTSNQPEFSGGTAIITCIDLDPDSKSERKEKKKYPVQIAPRVLTVNHSIVDSGVEDLDGNTWVDFSTHDETDNNSTTNHTTAAWESADMDEVIDFDSCEVVNFTTNLPQVLDVLAIKTLVLSATYTPEISDWREVVVKEIDIIDGTITVEHLGLTDTALREGGRFEVDATNDGGDHSMEAEHYVDDDSIVTLLKSDIVDMRRIR